MKDLRKTATDFTKKYNNQFLDLLPFADNKDFEDARRGFIATLDTDVAADNGGVAQYLSTINNAVDEQCPETVNPSLWRQARLNSINGLFKVCDGIYQVRSIDLANMTIIEGDTGLVIIDVLSSAETARAAIELYYQHCGKRPIKAIVYNHSHIDHFSGTYGIVSKEEIESGAVEIIAPEHFLEEAISENLFAGAAMLRRGLYQGGSTLAIDDKGFVDNGLGKYFARGLTSLIAPTKLITHTGQVETVDGVEMNFQLTPGAEAPAEVVIYFPQFKALCTGEEASHTLHNVLTLRGAEVRDAKQWWKIIDTMIDRYGDEVEVAFGQHHWPVWDNDVVVAFLENQRDCYKYLHDASVQMMNDGYLPTELSNMIELPDAVGKQWHLRGYYGTVSHDVRAVYQKYLGFYDSNPAHLNPLSPVESGKLYVEFMGGADKVIEKAEEYFAAGEYRWVAQVLDHVVFADPDNERARLLEADALEQLGYQSESGIWRNEYLTGAQELRNYADKDTLVRKPTSVTNKATLEQLDEELLFDYLGLLIDRKKAAEHQWVMNVTFTEQNRSHVIYLKNNILLYKLNQVHPQADVSITIAQSDFADLIMKTVTPQAQIDANLLTVEGAAKVVDAFVEVLAFPDVFFNIVTP